MYWQRVAAHVSIMYLRMGEIMVENRNGLLEILNQFIWEQIIKSIDRIYNFHINQVTKYLTCIYFIITGNKCYA